MIKNVALFIDCDKLEVGFISVIFDYLKNHSYNVCIKKAYIHKDNLSTWYSQLERQYCKITLGTSQANTNMNLSVGVAKAVYSGKYDAIAIASNYREFGVLASFIRSQGLEALCFYQYSKGNEAFLKRAYNIIYNLEPTQAKTQSIDIDNTKDMTRDMIEAFGVALEGLDTKVLGETLQEPQEHISRDSMICATKDLGADSKEDSKEDFDKNSAKNRRELKESRSKKRMTQKRGDLK